MIRFFILAGGYGKRARPLSQVKPKPLFPLHGTPLIELILNQLQKKGLAKGFINLHYKPEIIRQHIKARSDIICFHEKKLSGSKILKRAADFLGDDLLLVINGDVYLDIPVLQLNQSISKSGSDGVLLVRKDTTLCYSTLRVHQDKYLGVEHNAGVGVIYTGVALFKKSVVERINVSNFFQMLDKSQFDIRILHHEGIWLDIGDVRSYFKSNSEYRKYIKIEGHQTNSISHNVVISPDSRVEKSIIWENTRVVNNSHISNSIITGKVILDSVNYNNQIITEDRVYEL